MPPKFPKIDLIRQTLGASRAGSSARSRMRRFFDAREGMVAPILGFLLLPLGMSVGVAVDYAKAVKARTIFVAAVDASALAGVKAMYDGMPQDQVRTHVAKVLKSAAGPYAGSVTLDAIVPTTENTSLTASVYASLDLPLNFPTTSDAGACGQAGGLLGASFNGEKIGDSVRSAWQYNHAYSAYIVPGRAYKDARFYWTSDCASSAEIVRAGVPRLIK